MDGIAAGGEATTMTERQGVRFVIVCILLFCLANWLPEPLLEPLNRHTASFAGRLLALAGFEPLAEGVFLTAGRFRVQVIGECSALYAAILFGSFIVSTPFNNGRKTLGLLLGIPILHLINAIRIAAVVAAGSRHPHLFELAHVYLGQIVMVLVVLGLSLAWLRWASSGGGGWNARFILRLSVIAGLLFIPWLYLHRWYVELSDWQLAWLFQALGHPIEIPHTHVIYYHVFNLVTFASLVLASREIPPARKFTGILAGTGVLWISHQVFKICNILLTAFQVEEALMVSTTVTLVSQYLAPVVLWLLMVRHPSGGRRPQPKVLSNFSP